MLGSLSRQDGKTLHRWVMQTWIYTTPDWRRARAETLLRDGHRCTVTEYDFGVSEEGDLIEIEIRCDEIRRLHVHHVERPEDGGALFDPDNLLTLCSHHHAVLHSLQRQPAKLALAA